MFGNDDDTTKHPRCGPGDADGICAIYNHYVSNTAISFDEEPVTDMNPFSSCNQQAMPWVTAFSRYSCHSAGTLPKVVARYRQGFNS